MTVVIDSDFNPVPSLAREVEVTVAVNADAGRSPSALAVFVADEGALPEGLPGDLDREALAAVGFTGKKGQTLALPGTPVRVLVGVGSGLSTAAAVRDAVAALTRAAKESEALVVPLGDAVSAGAEPLAAAQAATEGAILSRYRYDALTSDPKTVQLTSLTIVVDEADEEQADLGVERGLVLARTASLARDLANTPPRHLSAVKFAEIARELGPRFGLEVEVFDREALIELGCGGLLGVNAGSVEEPRMVKLRFSPEGSGGDAPHLALVGKGIMYDSGGISLKPSNAMHAAMKLDMMGAAAVFSAMTALRELGAQTAVTGWLMCTDNMPSGSATKLGDVLTIRGGTTVEVKNTDAEGRLVMADGLVLATEEARRPDAIVDIATLTGAAMAALGTRSAAMLANDDAVAAQLEAAAETTDETIWRLPLDHRYRDQLKSSVADLSNIGGQYAGAILAALFLNEFVDELPWGHLDIAGTMQAESDDLWRSTGSTGFGARLLAEFATGFEAPKR
ncbi:leucyl aminopeptidase [Leucobacter weissii]|uniref:Probable cytosol aminopeptidase n=1 Tax=Leucobacter weissii TaxID=1983706 RepID=A0A939S5W6_9MICO|nr:leucyl aminopeptidase [Leucobacter weissii]MBO1901749.1 leucyl aminopeptidase [Leucobacter weissii]